MEQTAQYIQWTQGLYTPFLSCHFPSNTKYSVVKSSRPAMSNPNGLLSQKVCHYLNQGRTLNDILMRAAH